MRICSAMHGLSASCYDDEIGHEKKCANAVFSILGWMALQSEARCGLAVSSQNIIICLMMIIIKHRCSIKSIELARINLDHSPGDIRLSSTLHAGTSSTLALRR